MKNQNWDERGTNGLVKNVKHQKICVKKTPRLYEYHIIRTTRYTLRNQTPFIICRTTCTYLVPISWFIPWSRIAVRHLTIMLPWRGALHTRITPAGVKLRSSTELQYNTKVIFRRHIFSTVIIYLCLVLFLSLMICLLIHIPSNFLTRRI